MKQHLKLLAALFLVAQFFTIQHQAAFGFELHKHHGQLCEIFVHYEKSKFSDLPSLPNLPVVTVSEARLHSYQSLLLSKQPNKAALTRAPPTILQA